jgi:hypothetical protein
MLARDPRLENSLPRPSAEIRFLFQQPVCIGPKSWIAAIASSF